MHINFDWDEEKRHSNLAKHGVDFLSILEFDWTVAQVEEDARFDYGELRLRVVGPIGNRLHVAILAPREDVLRVISLRKANRRETREWLENQR